MIRAAGGAALAVTGVAVGLGALLLLRGGPGGTPALEGPLASIDEVIPYDELDAEPSTTPSPTELYFTPPGVSLSPSPAPPTRVVVPSPPPPPRATAATAPKPPVARPPLTVLNNSRYTGLAARAAEKFRAAGWPIRETGNAGGRFRTTTVYYEPGQRAAAEALARRFPDIRRVLPRFAELPGRGLTVVVTRDFDV